MTMKKVTINVYLKISQKNLRKIVSRHQVILITTLLKMISFDHFKIFNGFLSSPEGRLPSFPILPFHGNKLGLSLLHD